MFLIHSSFDHRKLPNMIDLSTKLASVRRLKIASSYGVYQLNGSNAPP